MRLRSWCATVWVNSTVDPELVILDRNSRSEPSVCQISFCKVKSSIVLTPQSSWFCKDQYSIIYVCHILSIYSSVEGHLIYFCFNLEFLSFDQNKLCFVNKPCNFILYQPNLYVFIYIEVPNYMIAINLFYLF